MFRGVARSHRRCIDVVATQSTITETGTSELIVDYILVAISRDAARAGIATNAP